MVKLTGKKLLGLLLAVLVMLGLAGCGEEKADVSVERDVTADDYSYVIPAGWIKAEKYSTDDKVFYCLDGHVDDETPDNISVEVKTNRYAADEHMQFRDAILRQLVMQTQGSDRLLTGDGTFTDDGTILYIFTISDAPGDDGELPENSVTTRQYYIIGEKKYALVHLTSFSGSEDTVNAADRMAKSFAWVEEE